MGHHVVHLGDLLRRHDLLRLYPVAIESVDRLATRIQYLDGRMGLDPLAAVGQRRIGSRHIDHLHFVGADRQRYRVGQRRGQAHLAGRIDDAGAPEFRVAVADDDRQFHRDRVQRMRERADEWQRAHVAAAEVMRAPIADAHRRICDDGLGVDLPRHQRGQIDEGLERGARLALRVRRTVELARPIIATADDGPYEAGRFHHHGRRLLRVIGRPMLAQLILDHRVGMFLKADVEAGADR